MSRASLLPLLLLAGVAAALPGCGGSGSAGTPTTAAGSISTPAATTPSGTTEAGALQGEANSAATGDIPDNQVFLTFRAAPWSMKYPEGWAQRGSDTRLTFSDKNNIVRVVIVDGPEPTAASIHADFASLKGARLQSGPESMQLRGAQAYKVVYTTTSAPNPVTGKRVTLQVDRYYLSNAGEEAIVDLGTPKGVDNVDAYRLMIESFRWR